jgi:nitrate reductase gamma subunit
MMSNTERIVVLASILWALIALAIQVSKVKLTRKDYSVRSGNPLKGVIYNFTWAMMPRHKETLRFHPCEFLIGVLMHFGVLLAILKAVVLTVKPDFLNPYPVLPGVIFGIASLCALYLFIRRATHRELRIISCPDDYFAILLTLDFITVSLLHEYHMISLGSFMIHAIVLFVYFPLGKLKHAVFFFLARADYGARLGYRGTYPAGSR